MARRSAGSAILAALYMRVAKEVDVPHMDFQRTHLWRTTLNKRLEEAGVQQSDRAAQLGHDEQTNERSYTDRTDTSALVSAYRGRHGS